MFKKKEGNGEKLMKKNGPKNIIFILGPSSIFEFKAAQKSGLLLPVNEHHLGPSSPPAVEVVAVSEKDLLYFGFMMFGMSMFESQASQQTTSDREQI